MSQKEKEQNDREFNILKKFNNMSDRLMKNINLLNEKPEKSNEEDDNDAINSYINENYIAGCDGNDDKDPEYLNFMEKLNNAPLTKKMDFLNVIHKKSDEVDEDVTESNLICNSTMCNGKNDDDDKGDSEDDPEVLEFIEKFNNTSDRLTEKIGLLNEDTEKPIDDTIAESTNKLLDLSQSDSGEVDDDAAFYKTLEEFNITAARLNRTLDLFNQLSERPELPECSKDNIEAYLNADSSAGEDDYCTADEDSDLVKFRDKFNNASDCLTKKIDLLNVNGDESIEDTVEANVNETGGDDKNNDDDNEPEFLEFVDKFNDASDRFTKKIDRLNENGGHGAGEGQTSKNENQ